MKIMQLQSLGLAMFIGFAQSAPAATLDAVALGGYNNQGVSVFVDNYFTGWGCCGGGGYRENRSYFVFDVTDIDEAIVAATLIIEQPPAGYASPSATEDYRVGAVSVDLATIVNGTGGLAAFDDLGTGALYGAVPVDDSSEDSTVSVPLNATALIDLNSAAGLFAIGGRLTSLIRTSGVDEFTFGFSNVQGNVNTAYLQIETAPVPLPAALPLLAGALSGIGFAVRRRRRHE